MPKEYVNPDSLFPSVQHGFSQVVVAGGRKMVFISGQTAWDIRKKIVGGDSLLEQARQALRNVQSAIEVTGGTLKDIVFLRIYIVNYQPEKRRNGECRPKRILFFGKSAGKYLDWRLWLGSSRISDRD